MLSNHPSTIEKRFGIQFITGPFLVAALHHRNAMPGPIFEIPTMSGITVVWAIAGVSGILVIAWFIWFYCYYYFDAVLDGFMRLYIWFYRVVLKNKKLHCEF